MDEISGDLAVCRLYEAFFVGQRGRIVYQPARCFNLASRNDGLRQSDRRDIFYDVIIAAVGKRSFRGVHIFHRTEYSGHELCRYGAISVSADL